MSQRQVRLFIEDMLETINKIEQFTKGYREKGFERDALVSSAVIRQLEVLGEAAANIPETVRANYAHIPWRRIVGLRNMLIHAYFEVDLSIIWQVVTVNLPETKKQLKEMLKDF